MVPNLSSSYAVEPKRSTILPLMALGCHQSPLITYVSVVDTRFTVAALVKVGRHQCPISYLKRQCGATRIRYLTTSDSGEPLGSTTLPLVIVGSHQVHYLPLVTLWCTIVPLVTVRSHYVHILTHSDSG